MNAVKILVCLIALMALLPTAIAGSLAACVVDANTSLPLANVTVLAVNASDTSQVLNSTTTMDACNPFNFNVTGLPVPENYTMNFSKTGYLNTSYGTVPLTLARPDRFLNSSVANVTMTAMQPGAIAGWVSNSTGFPVASAVVYVKKEGSTVNTVLANSQGFYNASEMVVDVYDVTASASGYVDKTVTNVVVSEGTTTFVNLTLENTPTTGVVTGLVTAVGGSVLSGATITAQKNSVTYGQTTTNSSGGYLLSLTAGVYDVSASLSGYYSSTASNAYVAANSTTIVDFALSPVPSPPPTPSPPPGPGGYAGGAGGGGTLVPRPTPSPTPTPTPEATPSPSPEAEGAVVASGSKTYELRVMHAGGEARFVASRTLDVIRRTALPAGYVSVFALTVRNAGNSTVGAVKVRERIPDQVAADPAEVSFARAPSSLEKESVGATWRVESLAAGGEARFEYSVAKKLGEDVLNLFAAPEITVLAEVTPASEALSPTPSPSPSPSPSPAALGGITGMFTALASGGASTVVGIAIVVAVVLLAYLFAAGKAKAVASAFASRIKALKTTEKKPLEEKRRKHGRKTRKATAS